MIMNMMVACVLGTILSLFVAYLYVYHRDWMDRVFGRGKRGKWGDTFSKLVDEKRQGFGGSSGDSSDSAREGMKSGQGRGQGTRPQLLGILDALDDREGINSTKLIEDWQKYASAIYLGGQKELAPITSLWERSSFHSLSLSFFKRLAVELLDQQAVFRNIADKDLREIATFNRLVVAVATLLLLMEDAEKGSRTITKSLIKNQSHEKKVFLAIEYWVFLKTGAAKNALLKQILNEAHPVGQRLGSLSYSKRVRLCVLAISADFSQVPDPKSLLASFVRVVDELALDEQKFRETEREQAQKKHRKEHRKEQDKKNKNSSKGGENSHSSRQSNNSGSTRMQTYLAVLGVSNGSDFKAVRKAYKKLAMEKHPDRLMSSSPSEAQLKRAHEEFLKIQEAYQYLEKNMSDGKKAA